MDGPLSKQFWLYWVVAQRAPSNRTHIDTLIYLAAWSCRKGREDSGLIFAKKASTET
jgi:hypothetical protein